MAGAGGSSRVLPASLALGLSAKTMMIVPRHCCSACAREFRPVQELGLAELEHAAFFRKRKGMRKKDAACRRTHLRDWYWHCPRAVRWLSCLLFFVAMCVGSGKDLILKTIKKEYARTWISVARSCSIAVKENLILLLIFSRCGHAMCARGAYSRYCLDLSTEHLCLKLR